MITNEQIEALRNEAAEAGDEAMVIVCDRALNGNEASRDVCECAILNAQAMA